MKKTIVVSFEGESVKVVFASKKGENLHIDDYMTLTTEEFDDFLSNDESDNYIVVSGFRNFQNDMVIIPKTKDRYIKPLVKREVGKRHAGFKDFVPLISFIGESVKEGSHRRGYFVISIDNSEINNLIDYFLKKQKSVIIVYPALCVLMSILPENNTPYLSMFEVGDMKNILLVKDGNIIFTRAFTFKDEDGPEVIAQNIDLTINYCKESLDVSPSSIIMIGEISNSLRAFSSEIPSIPFIFPVHLNVDQSVLNEYIIPIAALTYSMKYPSVIKSKMAKFYRWGKSPHAFYRGGSSPMPLRALPDINVATTEYKTFYYARSLLKYAAVVFFVLSIFSLGSIGKSTFNLIKTNKDIDVKRIQLSDISEVYGRYDIKRDKVMGSLKNVEFLIKINKQTHFADFLSALSRIKMEGVSIDSMAAQSSNNTANIEITGRIAAPYYYGFIKESEVFRNTLNNIAGVKGIDYKPDIDKRTYKVNFTYSSIVGSDLQSGPVQSSSLNQRKN